MLTISELSLSDHFPICLIRVDSVSLHVKHSHYKTMTYRCFKKFNQGIFQTKLAFSRLGNIESTAHPNYALDICYDIVHSILSKH